VSWPLLQQIALKVFSLATSSAASERNFSTFGFVHSKLRECLTAEKVEKLVYVKTNLPTLSTDSVCSDPDDDEGGDLSSSNDGSLLD
jgi:hAT family C-terminal dimerisation region